MAQALEIMYLHVNTYPEHGIVCPNNVAITFTVSFMFARDTSCLSVSTVNLYMAVTQDILVGFFFFFSPHKIVLMM